MTDDDNWDDVSFVISSRYRVETLRRLSEGPATPSLITDETGQSIAHVSRALRELREDGLITLLVSEDRRKGRVYGMTDTGEAVWDTIDSQNMAEAE
ncbi:winged helix-turn-helix domain-containing protein [Halomicroarcula limicola]|uniref:Winged helix-turn-helix domain-containing protein n=1 Tax=Haloarcula limicola TaxID=1429915 RepID=A0A8J7Y7Y3_9EURY|nr:winged helix-turn-helix domain-containing protein [Halomicroarcula limicola]MBV0925907.1 winged helix-turn-helix domain-containing protein [Halomicroarcula limicola]